MGKKYIIWKLFFLFTWVVNRINWTNCSKILFLNVQKKKKDLKKSNDGFKFIAETREGKIKTKSEYETQTSQTFQSNIS